MQKITNLVTKMGKKKRGMTLVELIGVMVVLAILAAIAIGGIISARDKANITTSASDLKVYESSVRQVLMAHPEVMKYVSTKPVDASETLINLINKELDTDFVFKSLTNKDSGGIAYSDIKRDKWKNPYGLYVYFDDLTPTYDDRTGTPLKESDSCVYIAIVSAGKNSTGGPAGINGENISADQRVSAANAMINNTDGIDDLGVIIRILNGGVQSATFGSENATLGALPGTHWIYGVPSATGGICHDYVANKSAVPTRGGSVDKYYDQTQLPTTNTSPIGSWTPGA